MNVDIIITSNAIAPEKVKGRTVVVIDILRASSVIITALKNGCEAVVPVLA